MPFSDDDLDASVLARYLSGESTPAESAVVRQWVQAEPRRSVRIEKLRAIWAAASEPVTASWGADPMWKDMQSQMARRRPVARSQVSRWWVGTVAGGLVAAAALVVVFGRARVGDRGLPVREFTTPVGGRASVVLRDGTRLTLGPDSRVRVPADYGSATRTVELEGEALFAVVHDGKHPFAVHTRGVMVTDIGTQFDVRAYREDEAPRVAVVEGIVDVRANAMVPSEMLHAGDVATVMAGKVEVMHDANVAALVTWVQGSLAFNNTPLRDVVRDLARTYNITINVTDTTLAHKLVTGSFTNQPVDAVLEDITAIVGARYERSGRTITIRRAVHGAWRPDSVPHPILTTVRGQDRE